MIRLSIPILLLSVWATTGLAQTVSVRSGEHEAFTRLVLNLPVRVPWKIEKTERGAVLRLIRAGLRIDVDTIFDRIPRGRLDSVRADGSSIILSLGCDCDVKVFWAGETMLVLDIEGRADLPAAESVDTEETAEAFREVDVTARRAPLAARLVADAMTWPMDARQQPPALHFEPDRPAVAAWQNAQETREVLVRQFGRAASQGLLSPRKAWPPSTTAAEGSTPEAPTEQHVQQSIEEARHAVVNNMNLRAESSIDQAFGDRVTAAFGLTSASGCVARSQIDILAWSNGTGLAEQIGPLRARLTGEFDKTDEETILTLARLYLHFGFGREAAQVAALLSNASAEKPILLEMADILEVGFSENGTALKGQLQCKSEAALWSALSYRTFPDDAPIDSDAILRAFAALPPHLRAFVGPMLSRRFLTVGRKRESEKVQKILNRNEITVTADSRLADAEIALESASEVPADEILEDVVSTNARPAAEALLRMLNRRLKRDAEISYEQVQLIGSYAFENRDQPIGVELARTQVAALAASGAFDEARAAMTIFLADHPDEAPEVRGTFLRLLTEKADDMTFLRHVLARTGDPAELNAEIANAAASRLLATGFLEAARSYVSPPSRGPQNRVRKMLKAEIALRAGLPRQAEVNLLGITGADANLLRAQARSMVGEHAAARDLFASANRLDEAEKQAWLAEGRPGFDGTEASTVHSEPVMATVEDLATAPTQVGTLAQNTVLLDEASDVRSAIEDLLLEHPTPSFAE